MAQRGGPDVARHTGVPFLLDAKNVDITLLCWRVA